MKVCYEAWKRNRCSYYSISHRKSYSIVEVARLFNSKIKYLPKRPGERYASALTNMYLTNKVQKRFGKIVSCSVRLRWCRFQEYYNDEWHGKWASDGGVINQQAIHHIDAYNWIVGPVEKVCSISANQLNRLEAEDTLVAILKLKNGGLGTIEATTAARPEDFEASISIVGEKGMAEVGGIALNHIKTWKFIDKIDDDSKVIQKYSQDVPTGYGLSHITLLEKIIDILLKNEKKNIISAQETILSTKLIHALYKSDEIKKWVNLDEKPTSKRLGKDN